MAVVYDQKTQHFRINWPASQICEGGFNHLSFGLDESVALLAILTVGSALAISDGELDGDALARRMARFVEAGLT